MAQLTKFEIDIEKDVMHIFNEYAEKIVNDKIEEMVADIRNKKDILMGKLINNVAKEVSVETGRVTFHFLTKDT